MKVNYDQIDADNRKMKRFIAERLPPDGTRIVLADGPDGEAWADLFPNWDDGDCDLHIETNAPEWVGLREVYGYFRRPELTFREREREMTGETNRWKNQNLERERNAMGHELNQIRQTAFGGDSAIPLFSALPDLKSIAKSLERIADIVDPPPPDKVDTSYVAKRLGIGLARVSQMASQGEIPPSCIVAGTGNGKIWKFHRVRIDQWIESR